MRTISVTGTGTLKVAPDLTRISITLEGVKPDYGEALKESAEASEQLRATLEGLGFERSSLKTLSFDVNTEYESYQEGNMYKQRFVGYRYSHSMKLEFDSDNELLGRTLYALAHSSQNPVFSISYTVKDSKSAKNELLGRSVADARHKAEVLTEAAGVKLLDIQSIEYSSASPHFVSMPMNNMVMAKRAVMEDSACGSYSVDIQPDDITVSGSVNVTWEIQ